MNLKGNDDIIRSVDDPYAAIFLEARAIVIIASCEQYTFPLSTKHTGASHSVE